MSEQAWPDYLRAAMAAAGYRSAAELSASIGINDSVVSRWMSGKSQPEVENLRRLAKALRRPLLELMVTAGVLEPAEAKMKDVPPPPATPVGAGVDPALLAELASAKPGEVARVKAYLEGIRDAGR